MCYGIAGAHGTGKTTLATMISEETGLPLILTNLGEVCKTSGYSPRSGAPLIERMAAQWKMLEKLESMYQKEGGRFIADRTPIDCLAYVLADKEATGYMSEDLKRDIQAYTDRCFEVANRYLSTVVITPSSIPYTDYRPKLDAGGSEMYREILNFLITGVASDPRCRASVLVIPRNITTIDGRVNEALIKLSSHIQSCQSFLETIAVH